ncbi:MAG: hypothetical protein LUD15_13540 [Bacteroides sp.]|nr:hypothetical protein [Bacteroides sp.]
MSNHAFIGHRQQHLSFTATTEIKFQPESSGTFAGLVCYQNEKNNIVFGKIIREGKEVIEVISSENGEKRTDGTYTLSSSETGKPVQLRIRGEKALYHFEISFDGKNWKPVAGQVDATILSTQKAGGFTGCIIGMYTGSLQ